MKLYRYYHDVQPETVDYSIPDVDKVVIIIVVSSKGKSPGGGKEKYIIIFKRL